MKKPPPLDPANGLSKSYEQMKPAAPAATWGDVKDAFGSKAVDTGSINLDLSTSEGVRNRGRLGEMLKAHHSRQAAESVQRDSKVPTVRMRTSNGTERQVPERIAERAGRNGLREVPSRSPTLRYVHGQWFRRVGKEWCLERSE